MIQGGSDSAAGVSEGDILDGKYRVERVLGIGGMGVVVAAQHIQLDEKVALKFLLPEALHNSEAVARFVNEARRAVKIKSEHVARVTDVGTLPNGAPYMVMEYLDGSDLSAWLTERGPLDIEQAVDFVLQACIAVAEAHGLGIVHRDLKPANLFCVRRADGQLAIKVLDFGISKMTDLGRGSEPPRMSVTKTSAIMGSPLYMSPEQMRSSKSADARSDIWALGVILYELFTARVPFDGEAATEVAVKVSMYPPPPLREIRPDIPVALEAVILRCLEKDRQQRYPNVAELALALLPFAPKRAKGSVERISGIIQAAGLSASALALPLSPQAPQAQHTASTAVSSLGTGPPLSQTTPEVPLVGAGGKAIAWVAAGAVVLGAAGVFGVTEGIAWWRRASADPPAKDAGPVDPLLVAADADAPPANDATTEACTPDSARCSGNTLLSCKAGQWIAAPIAAGQCGAVCTPGSSPPQCASGNVPRSCAPTGQWQDGVACDRPNICRDGACVSPPPPQKREAGASPAIRSNCDPPFTLDDQGRKHFKPECY